MREGPSIISFTRYQSWGYINENVYLVIKWWFYQGTCSCDHSGGSIKENIHEMKVEGGFYQGKCSPDI